MKNTIEFVEEKIAEFGEIPDYPRRRGRPRKKLCEKNFGSLVEENADKINIARRYLHALQFFDAYTIEFVNVVNILQVENAIADRLAVLKDIIAKKSRKYKGLDISGVRFLDVQRLEGAVLLQLRVVCTSFAAASFVAAHLIHHYEKPGYTGLHLHCDRTNRTSNDKKAIHSTGEFEMHTLDLWRATATLDSITIFPNTLHRNTPLSPQTIGHLINAARNSFAFHHLRAGDIHLIKGAIGKGERVDKNGAIVQYEYEKTYWHKHRRFQTFGTFYNSEKRQLEHHIYSPGGAWYEWAIW